MKFAPRGFSPATIVAVGLLFSTLLSSIAAAASINYGNFNSNPPGTMFLNVTESSGTDAVPLYGPPTFVGTDLGFTPTPAFSAAGAGGAIDLTDGQLNYTIMSAGVTSLGISEGGLYSLTGTGTPTTQVLAALSLRAKVTQINGVDITPITLAPSSAAVNFNLPANPGVNSPWALATSINVASQLAGLGYGPGQNATKVDVVIDNQLLAVSELLSAASIVKTQFGIPEPSAAALAGLALCCLGVARRRR